MVYWSLNRAQETDLSAFEPTELESLLGHEAVLLIGAEHRRQDRAQHDKRRLVEQLRQAAAHLGESVDPEAPMAVRLRKLAEEDLRAGRIVLVDGWVLSETEARQCELSLLAER